MKKSVLWAFQALIFFFLLKAHMHATDSVDFFTHIEALFTINDPQNAYEKINSALKNASTDAEKRKLLGLKIKALSRLAKEGKLQEGTLLTCWKEYQSLNPDNEIDETLLEEMSWAIIQKGSQDASPAIRLESALASFYAQDAKGISIIENILFDNNVQLRLFGLFISSHLRDESLQKRVLSLMNEDRNHYARLFCIETLGKMRSTTSLPILEKELSKKNLSREEKEALVLAMTNIHQNITQKDLLELFQSPHSTHRTLATSILAQNPQILNETLFQTLVVTALHDSSQEAALSAIQTLAILNNASEQTHSFFTKEHKEQLSSLTKSSHAKTQIAGAFLLFILGENEALQEKILTEALSSKNPSLQLFTTSFLINSGTKGVPLAKKWLIDGQDPLIKINLASFLIKQRKNEKDAAYCLKNCLKTYSPHIDWLQEGLFTYIGPMKEGHIAPIPRYPEAKNHAIRLDLWSMIATCYIEGLEQDLALFFKESSWGTAGLAAGLLIQEKEEAAIEILKKLLVSETPEIRLQAAFILAITTQDESALATLVDSYKGAKREHKEQILLAIGQIGSKKTLPFLCEALYESSPILRIRASSAILSCLYH